MTLAAAQANVSPELKQRLEIIEDSIVPHDLHVFTDREAAIPIVKFLLYPSGLVTPYQVLYHENELVIRNKTEAIYCYRFPVGTEVIAVDYLQSNVGDFGLIVLYNDMGKGYLARLADFGGSLKVVHEVLVPYPGTCVKVVIDDLEMPQHLPNLAKPMQKWTNIVVVGTKFAHAYVFYVPIDKSWGPHDKPQERNLTDALGTFHKEKDRNGNSRKFVYRSNFEGRADVIKPPRDVYVSSIAYIPRSCDLLLGLSFGGIVQVGFTPSGDIATNIFQSSAPVCNMVPMLPHDDPNMNVWFWAFHGERGKGLTMVLYEGSYRVVGQENVPLRGREFKKATFMPRMVDQPAEKGTAAEWVTAHTLTRERRLDSLEEDRMEEGSTPHNTTLNDTDIDLSQLFFCYKDTNGDLKFGLFDLNTYYYKRLQGQARPDSTPARQCPFLTNVAGPNQRTLAGLGNITDIMIDCDYITKFQFMEDAEQDIYVSGVNLMRINFASTKVNVNFKLCSLPMQVLDKIYDNMAAYTNNPQEATSRLTAVGLASNHVEQSRHTGFFMLMTAAVLYGYIDAIVTLIYSTTEGEWTLLNVVNDWMWSEVQRARNKLDTLNDVLFSDTAKALSADQKRQLRQVNIVLKSAKIVYGSILQKFKEWDQYNIIPRQLVAEHEVHLAAVTNLSDFSNCIRNLYHLRFLPLGGRNYEDRQYLENGLKQRRRVLSALNGTGNLFVDDIISKMQKISPDEAFWLEQSGKEWYPPALHNGVSTLLVLMYQPIMKKQFIIYYVIDIVTAKRRLFSSQPKPGFEGVLTYVEEILEGVLQIEKQDILPIMKIWYEEQNAPLGKTITEQPTRLNGVAAEDIGKKIEELASKPYVLSADEEKQLKEYCNKIPYGQFRYQLYLLERSRFQEVQLLPIPKGVENVYISVYSQALPGLWKLQQQLKILNVGKDGPHWPDEVTAKIKSFDPSRKLQAISPQNNNAKTPQPLFDRMRKLARRKEVRDCSLVEKITMSTPEIAEAASSLDSTPIIQELDDKAKEKISSILRTPTSRRARAVAAAEHQTGVQVTPESQQTLPAPTSIMKTPNRCSSHISPSRGIRWDPDFVEPSLDSSADGTAIIEPIPQVNFDTEESEDTEDDDLHRSMEEQSDEAAEESSDNRQEEEPVEIEERSLEIQEEDTMDVDEEVNQETVVTEEDKTLDVQTNSIRLVDYSLCESTFSSTPIQFKKGSMLARKWIDKDGNEHSFEQQEEEEVEGIAEQTAETCNASSSESVNNDTYVIETTKTLSPAKNTEVPQEIRKAASKSPVKIPPTAEEDEEEEKDEVPALDVGKYKKKSDFLTKKPPNPRRLKSEEPEMPKPTRARRSISESADIPESKPELRRSSRRSASRTNNAPDTPKSAQRALFKEELKKTPMKARRSRTPSVSRAASDPTEEDPKTPNTRSRTRQASFSVSQPVVAASITPTRRSRSRQASTNVSEPDVVEQATTRRSRTPSLKVAEVVRDASKSPSRRGKTKTPVPTSSASEEKNTQAPVTRSAKKKAPTPEVSTSTNLRSRSNTPSDDVDESKPVRKRGRPRKVAAEQKEEKPSAVSIFRANLAEKRNATTRKRVNTTESTDVPAAKKVSNVAATMEEEPANIAGKTRRTSRGRTQSQSQVVEAEEKERRSASRPKKSTSGKN